MIRSVPEHAAATSCTVPSPPTATTDTSSGSLRTMLPAWPGPCVTCQTGRNPRSSKNRETDTLSLPARPGQVEGTAQGQSPRRRDNHTETTLQVEESPGLCRRTPESHPKSLATLDSDLTWS